MITYLTSAANTNFVILLFDTIQWATKLLSTWFFKIFHLVAGYFMMFAMELLQFWYQILVGIQATRNTFHRYL